MLAAIDLTRSVRLLALLGLGAVVVGLRSLCMFAVDAGEYAVVTQFGKPVRVESTPGLKFKLPAPVQTVSRFDRRLFVLVPPPREFLTLGKNAVVASGFIVWKVHDPKRFMQTVFDRAGAESRLGDILFAELGAALGGAPFSAFVSTAPGGYRAEAILGGVTRQYRELALRDYGIDVVDVGLRRLDFPEQNRASVFARMKSERVRISMRFRSEGEEEGLKIRAASEKAKSGILGEAYKLSQKIRGEGEARAAKIYADSLARAPEFYRFVRSMDAVKTITYNPQTIYFTYCYSHPPAERIASGDTVITKTRDASNDAFRPTMKTIAEGNLDLSRVNPQTGPFYVEGAEPGDTLKVHLDKVTPNRDWGWGGAIPYFGALAPEYKTMMVTPPVQDTLFIWQLDRSRNVAVLNMPKSKIGRVEVPIRGFFGTIGTAPYGKECISSLVPGTHGANMDFNEVVEGVTMYFPVFEPGALFMIGDGHAAQGDGEIMGAAIETSFDVQFTVEVIKGKKINWPRLENRQYIMSIGSTRPLMDALRLACSDMINWLATDYGYDRLEAYQLLGQAAVIKIANVVDPQYSVACALDKKYLPR